MGTSSILEIKEDGSVRDFPAAGAGSEGFTLVNGAFNGCRLAGTTVPPLAFLVFMKSPEYWSFITRRRAGSRRGTSFMTGNNCSRLAAADNYASPTICLQIVKRREEGIPGFCYWYRLQYFTPLKRNITNTSFNLT